MRRHVHPTTTAPGYPSSNEDVNRCHPGPGQSYVGKPVEYTFKLEQQFWERALDYFMHDGGEMGDLAKRIVARRAR